MTARPVTAYAPESLLAMERERPRHNCPFIRPPKRVQNLYEMQVIWDFIYTYYIYEFVDDKSFLLITVCNAMPCELYACAVGVLPPVTPCPFSPP